MKLNRYLEMFTQQSKVKNFLPIFIEKLGLHRRLNHKIFLFSIFGLIATVDVFAAVEIIICLSQLLANVLLYESLDLFLNVVSSDDKVLIPLDILP